MKTEFTHLILMERWKLNSNKRYLCSDESLIYASDTYGEMKSYIAYLFKIKWWQKDAFGRLCSSKWQLYTLIPTMRQSRLGLDWQHGARLGRAAGDRSCKVPISKQQFDRVQPYQNNNYIQVLQKSAPCMYMVYSVSLNNNTFDKWIFHPHLK